MSAGGKGVPMWARRRGGGVWLRPDEKATAPVVEELGTNPDAGSEILAGPVAAPQAARGRGGARTQVLDLDRTQVRHLADVVAYLVGQHGATHTGAARALGTNHVTIGKILRRPASLKITHGMLARIAAAVGASVEQLLAGDVVLPETHPAAGAGPGRPIVRKGRRR